MNGEEILRVEGLRQYFRNGRSWIKAVDDVSNGGIFFVKLSGQIRRFSVIFSCLRDILLCPLAAIFINLSLFKSHAFVPRTCGDNPRMTIKEIIAEGLRIHGEKNEEIITAKMPGIYFAQSKFLFLFRGIFGTLIKYALAAFFRIGVGQWDLSRGFPANISLTGYATPFPQFSAICAGSGNGIADKSALV